MNPINRDAIFIRGSWFFVRILTLCFVLIGMDLKAQENFKIGDFLEVYNHDSLRVSYSSTGRLVGKKFAKFIRKGKIDPIFMNVAGQFKDYEIKGNLVFKSTMINNYLNGEATYYYANGKIKEEGKYKDDIRTGMWKYYYPDGKIAKLVTFDNGEMIINESYSKNGKQEVKDGNGKIMVPISKFRQPDPYEASGILKDGKLDGNWKLFARDLGQTLSMETFEAGRFVKGESYSFMGNDTYTDYPRIVLKTFYPNEAVDLSEGDSFYSSNKGIKLWEFKGMARERNIYQMLLDSFVGKYKNFIADQWIIIGFRINENNSLSNIQVSSSSHDEILNKFVYDIFEKSAGWKAGTVNGEKESSDVFFSVVIKEKKILFPAFYKDVTATKLDKTWERILLELPTYDSVMGE